MYHANPEFVRNWSLNANTIHDIFRGNDKLKYCGSSVELADSIANRIEDYTCNVEWIGVDELCGIMSKFSKFYMIGDSLVRHMAQSLFMILTNDFRYGGYPRVENYKPQPYFECGCDGQFSEHKQCRDYSQNFCWRDIRDLGFCSHSTANLSRPFAMQVEISYKQQLINMKDLCTPYDTRPKFIFLQGGAHYETSSYYFWRNFLKHMLTTIANEEKNCPSKAKYFVVYSGVISNNEYVSKKYPDQSDHNTALFNYDMHNYLKAEFPHVVFLNYWNLSHTIMLQNRTSDGFHQLSDSNLIKSMMLLNAIKLAAKTF